MSFPDLPAETFSHLGPVPVSREDLTEETLFGQFLGVSRRIRIHNNLPPAAAWQTFWHETGHLLLHDAGVAPDLGTKMEERVVDAFGLYLAAAVRAGFLKVVP